jgi:hypothetical protein
MRVLALRHDALKTQLAGVREHQRAVRVVEVLVEAQSWRRASEQAGERRFAHRERVAPQIVAVEFDQVEGIEEHARVVALVPDAVERRDPVVTTGDCLAVDDAGPRMQCGERLDDEREAVGQVDRSCNSSRAAPALCCTAASAFTPPAASANRLYRIRKFKKLCCYGGPAA